MGHKSLRAVTFTSKESRNKEMIHGLVKQTQFCVSCIAPCWWNGSFQRPESFLFLSRSLFRSSPVVMNLRWRLKEYCQKNKRQRWDICEEFSVWHFATKNTGLKSVKPGTSSHFSESKNPSYVIRPCVQNLPGNNAELSASGYSLHPRESGPEVVQGPGYVTASPTFLGPVLAWRQQNYLRLLLIMRYVGSF